MMRVDIWSDYVCPWCYIGKRELDNAVQGAGMEDQVYIEYHAFELNPDAPTEQTLLFYDHLQEKRGVTLKIFTSKIPTRHTAWRNTPEKWEKLKPTMDVYFMPSSLKMIF